ncbi:hypothetical protein L917_09393, partial [Phytophthora nicotianae]
ELTSRSFGYFHVRYSYENPHVTIITASFQAKVRLKNTKKTNGGVNQSRLH